MWSQPFEDLKKNLLNQTRLIIHKLKEPNKWEKSETLTGIIVFAIDVHSYDLGDFRFTLHAMKDYFLHTSQMM